MLNERITEDIVDNKFRSLGYYDDDLICVEKQRSRIESIDKLLKNASKKGSGKGYPEFIVTYKNEPEFVLVVECKADVLKHESPNKDRYADYAVDGAKLYAGYLSKEKDVLYVGVSGQTEQELKVSHYLKLKEEKKDESILGDEILSFDSYLEQYKKSRFRIDYENLIEYIQGLNKDLHKKKIPENNRAILFSGILIALEDDFFFNSFQNTQDAKRLSEMLVSCVHNKLVSSNVPSTRIHEMDQAFSFIRSHTALIDEGYLTTLVKEIHDEVRSFIKNNTYIDILSKVYIEFLKYANNDKSLGIVLTPDHITGLFCDLANINNASVVLDNCCGTGGFLVAAMDKMIKDAKGNKNKIDNIKKKQLLGIEYQDHIFTLCASNMIIHGDGKTNIIKGDCFKKINELKEYNPTVGFLNPPYNDVTGINELEFVFNNLSIIQPNGIVIAILPMRCALYQKGDGLEIKKKILKSHTLEAVMSMPQELFYPVGVVTCIMVFRAHISHEISNKKTWFGYWRDDGFVKIKHKGRVETDKWEETKERWLEFYRNRETKAGESVLAKVCAEDEWCAEAYMETDYSKINQSDFEKVVRDYALYKMQLKDINGC